MKENPLIKISDIKAKDQWFDLRVTCTAILDFMSESIAQKGYVADKTGAIEFVLWGKSADAGVPELKKGKSYELRNVVSNEWRGKFSIALVRTTQVREIPDFGVDVEIYSAPVEKKFCRGQER